MSGREQEGENHMDFPFQSIYQDPQNFFSNLWNVKTNRLEFTFLEVSAFIENTSHRLVLQDANSRKFFFDFHIFGKIVDKLPPNTLCLDVGNRFCTGILDHHHLEKKTEKRRIIRTNSAASLVYQFPQRITEAIDGGKSDPLNINLPMQPVFDAVAATFLAVYYLIHQYFPIGSRFIADYARMQDEGNTPYIEKFTLATSPSAILHMANSINKKSLLQQKERGKITNGDFNHILNNLMLLTGLVVLENIFAEFQQKKLDEKYPSLVYYTHIHKLFQHENYKVFTDAIKNDYLIYLEDVKRAETYIVTVQINDTKALCKQMWEMVENPRPWNNEKLFQILENRISRLPNPNDEVLVDIYDCMLEKLALQQQVGEDTPDNSDEFRQKLKLKEKLLQLKQKADLSVATTKTDIPHRYENTNMIILENPESVLFNDWAWLDRLHCSKDLKRNGFDVIFSILTPSDTHSTHRFVIIVNPKSNITLKSISRKLEHTEKKIRQQANLQPLGKHRPPGYGTPNPWFDGRGTIMEDTIVDTPVNGTLIDKEKVKRIVFEQLKAQESIFSGNLCFISKIDNFDFDRLIDADANIKNYERLFFRDIYHLLSSRFLRLDMKKLHETRIIVSQESIEGDILVKLQGIQLLRFPPSSAILSIDFSINSNSGLKLFSINDDLVNRVCRKTREEISKKIYKSFSGSDEIPEQHMLLFFKIGEGKQFYRTGEIAQETSHTYYEIFQQKSTFSIHKKDYKEFYQMVQLIAMHTFHLKKSLMAIDSRIEEYMKDKQIRLNKIETLRQELIGFISREYSVEITSVDRYTEIWKRFLEKFEVNKYIEEAKWQCAEISNYYMEDQSFKINLGVAILSWLIAPIGIAAGILQINSANLKPICIYTIKIDPTLFWLALTLVVSIIGYAAFMWIWPWCKKKWIARKKREKK